MRTLRVGISACLLGEHVRWDGGHKREAFLAEVLAPHVEWVPVCPEVELGLGVPRPPIRLIAAGSATRLAVEATGEDLTERMRAYAGWRAKGLASLELDGYVLKSRSPSCGLTRVPVHGNGIAAPIGRGLFAEALAEAMPHLPMEDERRLRHPSVREHFLERLLAAARWRALTKRRPRAGDLQSFHGAHKYAILAHSPAHYAKLGRLVANAGKHPVARVMEEYGVLFMQALTVPATRGRHVNVLEHIAGFFKTALPEPEREALAGVIERYRRGATPLAAPLTLIRDQARRLGVAYLDEQVYLGPRALDLIS
jgi:uncharacterized protein YbbK (DUF523 family)/uncharacterized protein YbgA (DUF1722 family)